MRKKVRSIVHEAVTSVVYEYLLMGFKYLATIILALLLIFNIRASQKVHPLYFQFTSENVLAAADVVKHTQPLPDGPAIEQSQVAIFGNQLLNSLNQQRDQVSQLIRKYTSILNTNPNSRDALYNLYPLYTLQGDKAKADEYLKKAQAIDPTINGK